MGICEIPLALGFVWINLKIQGTAFIKLKTIKERIVGLTTRNKKDNIAGMPLADLVVSPLGRFVLGKNKDDFKIIENKLWGDWKDDYWGKGLVVLPKKIRPGPAPQFPAYAVVIHWMSREINRFLEGCRKVGCKKW